MTEERIAMKYKSALAGALAASLTMISVASAQVAAPTDTRIDPAKIKSFLEYARTNKEFAETSASHLDVNAPPRAIGDSDPVAVKQIVALEMAIQKAFNSEYYTHPDAVLRYYVSSPDRSFFDIVTPGEYYGDEMNKLYNYIGPQFIGEQPFREIKVYAKGDVGFVYMKQDYYGKSLDGVPVHWIMRQTDGVIKQNGEWKVLHTHLSFPVDIKTWKADLLSTKTPLPWNRSK